MSKPREGWWSYAKWVVRKYPERCRELEELRSGGGGSEHAPGAPQGISRPTEQKALRELPRIKQREYDAVRLALDAADLRTYPALRRDLISLVFWRRTHTLQGAAMVLNISYDSARLWQRTFLRDVGRYLDLCEDYSEKP